MTNSSTNDKKSLNFLEQIVENDLKLNAENKAYHIHTRFPPEPNGYLHIGHAKSICLNFGLAGNYSGLCNLRFDDTNPVKEDIEYVDSIKEDVKWLGFSWDNREYYASDYFDQLYQWAILLIKKGFAYICDMTADEISDSRGTPTIPGKLSPYRNRGVEENLSLFEQMKNGKFKDGEKSLRAKIDMASPNMHMRDPVLYRIKHASHHRTGDKWCIYPMYDFAHGQSDFIEGITHSICTLEFEVHRPLYEWFLEHIAEPHQARPRQIEFARLNLTYTVMSKRKLLKLVQEKYVDAWDDPRMPTISGLRRRGFTPESIRNFAAKVGVAKRENTIDVALLEHEVREHLNSIAQRRMCVLNPLKIVITNYPENTEEFIEAVNNPENIEDGKRLMPFSNTLFIEQEDFMENPPKDYFRLSEGKEVRLKYAYLFKCEKVIKDADGKLIELQGTYDKESKGGKSSDGRKVKGIIHWVAAKQATDIEVRLYDRLFLKENPDEVEENQDFLVNLNPNSLTIVQAKAEPELKNAQSNDKFQFERIGYFCLDRTSTAEKAIFNKTVGLKDSWAKIANKS